MGGWVGPDNPRTSFMFFFGSLADVVLWQLMGDRPMPVVVSREGLPSEDRRLRALYTGCLQR